MTNALFSSLVLTCTIIFNRLLLFEFPHERFNASANLNESIVSTISKFGAPVNEKLSNK